jgi:hypothetical protein
MLIFGSILARPARNLAFTSITFIQARSLSSCRTNVSRMLMIDLQSCAHPRRETFGPSCGDSEKVRLNFTFGLKTGDGRQSS